MLWLHFFSYLYSNIEVWLPANNTGSVIAVLNKCIYIMFPSVNPLSQVWHSGSWLLLKGGKYSELHAVRFWQAQLLYTDGPTKGHCDVLPRSLGGAAEQAFGGARHGLQWLSLVRRGGDGNAVLACQDSGWAGATALHHQWCLLQSECFWGNLRTLLAVFKCDSHQD